MQRDVATCSSARSSPLPPINQQPRQQMPPTFPSTKEFVSATPRKRAPLRSGIPVYTATYKRKQPHPLKPLTTGRSLSHDGDHDVTKGATASRPQGQTHYLEADHPTTDPLPNPLWPDPSPTATWEPDCRPFRLDEVVCDDDLMVFFIFSFCWLFLYILSHLLTSCNKHPSVIPSIFYTLLTENEPVCLGWGI